MALPFLFQVFPTSGLPIYRQLMDQVRRQVGSGRLAPGAFLPSVRQVAMELEVNPMTVSKAYSLLEREGLLEQVRGLGMRVCDGNGASASSLRERQEKLMPLALQLVAEARQLSLTPQQTRSLIDRAQKELDAK